MNVILWDVETLYSTANIWRLWDKFVSAEMVVEERGVFCVGWKWLGDDGAVSVLTKNTKSVKKVHAAFMKADAMVTFNGKKFDIKHLNTLFLRHGLTPLPPIQHIDLYQVVKKNFAFLSNKMGYVCEQLGLGSKLKTGGLDLWKKCLAGDKEATAHMLEYNIQDVELLEKLYLHLLPYIGSTNPNRNVFEGTRLSCPSCGSHNVQRRGTSRSKTLLYQRFQCNDCGSWSKSNKAEPRDNKQPLYVPL